MSCKVPSRWKSAILAWCATPPALTTRCLLRAHDSVTESTWLCDWEHRSMRLWFVPERLLCVRLTESRTQHRWVTEFESDSHKISCVATLVSLFRVASESLWKQDLKQFIHCHSNPNTIVTERLHWERLFVKHANNYNLRPMSRNTNDRHRSRLPQLWLKRSLCGRRQQIGSQGPVRLQDKEDVVSCN